MELQRQLSELKIKKALDHQVEDKNRQADLSQVENEKQRLEQSRDFHSQYGQHFQKVEFPNDNRQDNYEKEVKNNNMQEIEATIMEHIISK